jgi:hypothetical protein
LSTWTTQSEDVIIDLALDFRHQHGTKENPYIVMADATMPEQNGVFDIVYISKVKHSNYECHGFHIRKTIDVPEDKDAWDAFIPSVDDFPQLALLMKRVVVIKGPSRGFWTQHFECYHKKWDCEVTKKVHEALRVLKPISGTLEMSWRRLALRAADRRAARESTTTMAIVFRNKLSLLSLLSMLYKHSLIFEHGRPSSLRSS